jgi:copper resistance protein B
MSKLMEMDDAASYGKLLLDRLEWRNPDRGAAFDWDAEGYYGDDYNKLWLRTEGERIDDTTEGARVEGLWDHIVGRWWSSQVGARHDFGPGVARDWLAVGVRGLAPYFFQVEAAAYVGDGGRTAARFKVQYELLVTQRLILQPEVELNAYGKTDRRNAIASGLSDTEIALRLRYEIRREIAPYIGVAWVKRRLGDTALPSHGSSGGSDLLALAGIRFSF